MSAAPQALRASRCRIPASHPPYWDEQEEAGHALLRASGRFLLGVGCLCLAAAVVLRTADPIVVYAMGLGILGAIVLGRAALAASLVGALWLARRLAGFAFRSPHLEARSPTSNDDGGPLDTQE